MAYSSSSSPEIFPAPTTEIQDRGFSYKHATHEDVLEDLSSRFILNLPDEELASLERICFQVEQAHWFYEDFIREENPKFPSLPLKKFSAMLFHACPLLHQWSHDHEQAFNTFMQYKTRVPVCGAIMLNDTWEKCILVKGWKSSSGWGFPKGKINENEPEHLCAMREVLEETGYNLAGQINPEDVIQMSIKEQKISLYIVPGVPEDFEFKTRTRKEISRIEWFKLTDLPTWKRNKAAPGKFYLISPFIGALKAFINERKPRGSGRKSTKPNNIQNTQDARKDVHSSQANPKCHSHAQGSSSQSSSQDNCDPQTPSPQYCEPPAHHASDGRVPLTMANIAATIDIQALDPHFARLLSSLSSSTTAVLDNQGNDKPVLGFSVKELSPPTSKTPVPAAASSTHAVPDAADWSSSVPTNLSNRPTGHIPYSRPMLDGSPISPPSQPSYRSSTPPTETQHNGPGSQISSSTVFSSMSNLSNPAQSLSSRRTSSTADISPYLSRPPEMPTSGKRLKQLALLETVADESARMTPILAERELQLPQLNRHPIGSPCGPGPPPVTTSMNDMNDLRVIYSSGPGAVQGAAAPPAPPCAFNSHPHSHLHSVHDDPFRAGEAYHRGPSSMFHPPPPSIGRQVSVPQSQLVPGIYPSPHQMQGYRLPFPPVPQQGSHRHMLSGLPSQLGGHAPHVLSPSQSVPAPLSPHAASPGFDLPIPLNPSGKSSSLLSILNGGRSSGTNGHGDSS